MDDQEELDRTEIEQGAKRLDEFLDGEVVHQQEILEILDHHLVRDIDDQTSTLLFDAVAIYADEEFAVAFLGYMSYADQDPLLRTAFEDHLSQPVRLYLRKALAMHGARATEAVTALDVHPLGWRDLNREVFLDVVSGLWKVKIEIETYGGQRYSFIESPTSAMALTHAILDTLMMAVESAGVDVVDQQFVPELRQRMQDFLAATDGSDTTETVQTAGVYV